MRLLAVAAASFGLVAGSVHCGRTGLLLDDAVLTVQGGGADGGGASDARFDPDAPFDADGPSDGDAEISNDPQIAAGEAHACMRTPRGDVFCWGANELGQLGDGTQTNRASAAKVGGLPTVARVAAGTHHTCALGVDGSVWCWGGNTQAEQGNGVMGPSPVLAPTKVDVPVVIGISGGGYHTCAFDAAGSVYCWGHNVFGQSGAQGTPYVTLPKKVPNLEPVLDVGSGWEHTCAVLADRTVRCWGRNQDGQIGNGQSGGTEVDPEVALAVTDARFLFAGDDHTCAILLDGAMQCWGDDENGELGSGAALFSDKALRVVGMTEAYQGGGGQEHTCVATRSGTVYCWGKGLQGQLGIGPPTVLSKVPAQALALSDARGVATGEDFSCAVHRSRGAMCWGKNERGQLGSGNMNDFGDKPGYPSEVQGL